MGTAYSPAKYNPEPYGREHPLSKPSPVAGSASSNASEKTKAIKREVDDVVDIMRDNIDKVIDRGDKLDDLNRKTDDLQLGAMQFRRNARTVRKNLWWKNVRLNIFVGLIVLLLIGGLVWIIYSQTSTSSGNDQNANPGVGTTQPAPPPSQGTTQPASAPSQGTAPPSPAPASAPAQGTQPATPPSSS